MCPAMFGLFSTGASVAEVIFFMFGSVLLQVADNGRHDTYLDLVCSTRRTLQSNFLTFSIWFSTKLFFIFMFYK